jgi:hypothetical protein
MCRAGSLTRLDGSKTRLDGSKTRLDGSKTRPYMFYFGCLSAISTPPEA